MEPVRERRYDRAEYILLLDGDHYRNGRTP